MSKEQSAIRLRILKTILSARREGASDAERAGVHWIPGGPLTQLGLSQDELNEQLLILDDLGMVELYAWMGARSRIHFSDVVLTREGLRAALEEPVKDGPRVQRQYKIITAMYEHTRRDQYAGAEDIDKWVG
jgi:hypothetical protein